MTLDLSDYIIGATLAMVAMLWLTWRRDATTVGLPLCYLLSLGMIHFLGGLIYLLPWQNTMNAAFVAIGFREYLAGLIAFLAGVIVVEWFEKKRKRRLAQMKGLDSARKGEEKSKNPVAGSRGSHIYGRVGQRKTSAAAPIVHVKGAEYLPALYLTLGLLFVGVFIPILRSVPSIGAVAGCGAYLMVMGFCLACWRHWIERNRMKMLMWLLLTLGFPAFTTLALGFIGYGTVAMLVVLAFVTTFYRPRWQAVLSGVLLMYLGLSAFVTYMRDRTEYREGIQAGEGMSDRAGLIEMFTQFEFFQPRNEYHLFAVDNRLNQNWLVGMAVVNLELGSVPYARGDTLFQAVQAMVPRIIWPDKPVRAGSPEVVSHFTGTLFAEDTSVGIGQVMEFYINFGRWGLIIGFFIFGILIRWIDLKAAIRLSNGDWRGFVTWFLPGLTLLQAGGSLVEITSSALASIVLVIGINKFVILAPHRRKTVRDPQKPVSKRGIKVA